MQVNIELLKTRIKRNFRKAMVLQHNFFESAFDEHSRKNILLPFLDKTSLLFNLKASVTKFCVVMHTI